MTNLVEKITADWKESVKSKDLPRKQTLVMARAAIQNETIQKRGTPLDDKQVQAVLKRMVKQLNESLELIASNGTEEQKSALAAEAVILQSYLPEQLSEDEVRQIVQDVLSNSEHTLEKFGLAMKAVMGELKGKADGKLVQRLVKETLK